MKALGWIACAVGAYLFYSWYESTSTIATASPVNSLLNPGTDATGTLVGATPVATPAAATASGMQIGSPAWVAATSSPGSPAWVKALTVSGGVPMSPDATVAQIMADSPKLSYAQAVAQYNNEVPDTTSETSLGIGIRAIGAIL
jgi:hypothetical protein